MLPPPGESFRVLRNPKDSKRTPLKKFIPGGPPSFFPDKNFLLLWSQTPI